MSDPQAHKLDERSTYILDGATNKLGPEEVPFTMELLYLLLPIIGAFVLLFSVCCCGKTLKKMLHIPKEVVMGSYAAMQMHNHSTHSSSDSDSSSSDEEDEEQEQEGIRRQGVQDVESGVQGHRQEEAGPQESDGHPEQRGCSIRQHEGGIEEEAEEREEGPSGQDEGGNIRPVVKGKEQQRNGLCGAQRQNRRTVSEPAEGLNYVPNASESAHQVNNDQCISIECEDNIDNHPFSVVIIPRCDINIGPNANCDTSSKRAACQCRQQCTQQQTKCQCNAKRYCNNGEKQKTVPPKHSKTFCGCSDITPKNSVHNSCAKSPDNSGQCQCRKMETAAFETLDATLLDKTCTNLRLPDSQSHLNHGHYVDKSKSERQQRPLQKAKDRFHKHFKKCPHGRCVSRDLTGGRSRDLNGGRSRDRKRASRDHLPIASLSQSCPLLTDTEQSQN